METLVDILRKETETLRVQYLNLTEKWAKSQVLNNIERYNRYKNLTNEDYKSMPKYLRIQEQKFYHNTPSWYFKEELYVPKMIQNAEIHYMDSIEKLASRILKKGLDINSLKVQTSHIGVNIDTTITDGTKTINAYTIIASGCVQRPHYRYLIK